MAYEGAGWEKLQARICKKLFTSGRESPAEPGEHLYSDGKRRRSGSQNET